MKRPQFSLFFVLCVISLTAFGFVIQKDSENLCEPVDLRIAYDVNSRFYHTITKESLLEAETIHDILPTTKLLPMDSYYNVTVQVYSESCQKGTPRMAHSGELSDTQKELLRSLNYGSNFYISARERSLEASIGCQSSDSLIYYISVIPHKQANYSEGKDELISYLDKNSHNVLVDLQQGQLQPGKLHFVVTADGEVENVRLSSSSGFELIDNRMIELMKDLPGSWDVALDKKGEKVNQELVLSFGMIGC